VLGQHMTKDHVVAEDDFSDTELAEHFLHHRVLIVPIAREGKVHGVVTRNDFFKALAERLLGAPSGKS
jgi:predicted transcriptional regulator